MTPKQYKAASVRQLAAVVDGMAGTVSEGRVRQLRMVVGMFDRAVGREEMPGRASRSAEQLFTSVALGSFWDLAVDGELRARGRDMGVRLPLATQQVVLACLRLLADRVVPGREVRLPVLPALGAEGDDVSGSGGGRVPVHGRPGGSGPGGVGRPVEGGEPPVPAASVGVDGGGVGYAVAGGGVGPDAGAGPG